MSERRFDRLVSRRIASNEFDKRINVHVAMDNTLILDDIRKIEAKPNDVETNPRRNTDATKKSWKPLVIIIPLRLGLNEVNVEYIDQIKVNRRVFHTSLTSPSVLLPIAANVGIHRW